MRCLIYAALVFAPVAMAMPSDLPWDSYQCDAYKIFEIKRLSDGLAIVVRVTGTGEIEMTMLPVDEEKQAGFKDGEYKGEGDALLILKDGMVTLTGTAVPDAPFENCHFVELPPPG